MNLLQLEYFKKVAELQHISRSAQELMVSQPSLTKTIRHLENELEVSLFNRSGNSISLNKNGEIVLKYTNHILQSIDDMATELKDTSTIENKTILIAAKAAILTIPKYVLGFKKLFPDINISITQTTSLDSNDKEALSNYDYFIDSSLQKISRPNVLTLLEEPCYIAFPNTHKLAKCTTIDVNQCSNERFLLLRKQSPVSSLTYTLCKNSGFTPQVDLTCDSWDTIYSLIESGLGIAILPSLTWNISKNKYNIVLVPTSHNLYRYINLWWNVDAELSETAKLFRRYLIAFFSDLNSY